MIRTHAAGRRGHGARRVLMSAVSALVIALAMPAGAPALAPAPARTIEIEQQPLGTALIALSTQSDSIIYARSDLVRGKTAPAISGTMTVEAALDRLLAGSGLGFRRNADGSYVLTRQSSAPGADGSRGGEDARSDAEDAIELEEVVVTGTNIRGAGQASAVFSFDRDQIAVTGLSSTQDFIETLPQNFSLVGADQNIGGFGRAGQPRNSSLGSGVDLRGLGPTSTLTLLNGNRLAPSSGGTFVDVSVIPLPAIERIEVLMDGASAVYGSDAIAGVVNFILRDDYDGVETSVRYGTVTDGNLDQIDIAQSIGKSWGSGNILATYEYFNRDELEANQRAFAAGRLDDPTDLLPRQERHSALLAARQRLFDNTEVFFDGLYSALDNVVRGTLPSGLQTTTFDVQAMYALAGMRVDFAGTRQLEISGSYTENQIDRTTVRTTGPLPSSSQQFVTAGANVKLDGAVVELPGGMARVAVGGGRSETSIWSRPPPIWTVAGMSSPPMWRLFCRSSARPIKCRCCGDLRCPPRHGSRTIPTSARRPIRKSVLSGRLSKVSICARPIRLPVLSPCDGTGRGGAARGAGL